MRVRDTSEREPYAGGMSNARLPLALSILLVAACGDAGTSPTTDADAGTDATTAGCASEGGDSSTTDADASTLVCGFDCYARCSMS